LDSEKNPGNLEAEPREKNGRLKSLMEKKKTRSSVFQFYGGKNRKLTGLGETEKSLNLKNGLLKFATYWGVAWR